MAGPSELDSLLSSVLLWFYKLEEHLSGRTNKIILPDLTCKNKTKMPNSILSTRAMK